MMRDILVPHQRQPLAVQIRSRRICHSLAAFLQRESFSKRSNGLPYGGPFANKENNNDRSHENHAFHAACRCALGR
ncbi:TPA_asm: hypothetical protein GNB46_003551 [Salmonella enterica subsp. enterica serovar Infantis]|uniref:Uncharacterized protein n=1 Tax=Salmonella enterica subsp. enterica serovar Infantis str. CFSAN000522 TaxID=1299258 RepID=A0A5Y7AGN3_SALIN|nr:hypothetical protein [Salmonella enterica subsp. enterica serovar Infantis str. CFSAN000522]HAE6951149.1 hypothetical protein [Salmonella enterica subsp. enterica serovar Infantis]